MSQHAVTPLEIKRKLRPSLYAQNVYHSFNFKLRKYNRFILHSIARFLSPFSLFVLGGVQKR